jgi:nucleoside-diphosphate kinase
MKERTLTIIKPDAVKKKCFGIIIQTLLDEGFEILNLKWIRLTREQAGNFYAVHRERPFFNDLVAFMTSGPVIPIALEREGAVAHLRKIMGATDPKKAEPKTIRANFAESIQCNAIHGSDSIENAKIEASFFFADYELGISEPQSCCGQNTAVNPPGLEPRPCRTSQ